MTGKFPGLPGFKYHPLSGVKLMFLVCFDFVAGYLWKMFVQEGATGVPGGPEGASLHGMLYKDSVEFTGGL